MSRKMDVLGLLPAKVRLNPKLLPVGRKRKRSAYSVAGSTPEMYSHRDTGWFENESGCFHE